MSDQSSFTPSIKRLHAYLSTTVQYAENHSDRSRFVHSQYKIDATIFEVLHRNTHKMPTSSSSSTSSTPEHSYPRSNPCKKCHLLPLPSAFHAIPILILFPACSDVEHPPRNFNVALSPNPSPSPSTLTKPSNTAPLPPSTLCSSLLSPPADVPEIHHYVHTVRINKEGTSICNSDRKLNGTPGFHHARMSPPSFHHQLQLFSPTQDIPVLELPPSVFDAGCLPCISDTSYIQDFGLLSPATPTHVNHVPHFVPSSSLQSPLDDIPTVCLPPTLSQE